MSEQELDRSHAATPFKLEKARERGQVAKSPDVVSAVVFTAAMLFLSWQGWKTWAAQFRIGRALLASATQADAAPEAMWTLAGRAVGATLALSAPFFLTLLVGAVVGNVVQTGPVLSVEPIKADWGRLSPARGLKQLFSTRTLFNGARALVKLSLLAWVVYLALQALVPRFFELAGLPAPAVAPRMLDAMASLGLRCALMLALIALVDSLYTRREFAKQMRMSRRELKDELKHREGDPMIRARLRELRRELLRRARSLRRTRESDVVITNPTHFAVALRYVHGEMESPRLVAKGAGLLAKAMRGVAARHRIPVVQNPEVARALFRGTPLDGHVPPELYGRVARIIVWVFAMRDAAKARAGGADAGRLA